MTRTLGLLAVGLYRMAGVFDRLAARASYWRATRPLERFVDAVLPVAWVPFLGACWLALTAVAAAHLVNDPDGRWVTGPFVACLLLAAWVMWNARREAQ